MNVFVVLAHPEPQSFNAAMFRTAVQTLREAGHSVATSDLYAMGFDPVSSRRNFTTTRDPDYLKLQLEEMHATELDGFAADLDAEMATVEACDLIIKGLEKTIASRVVTYDFARLMDGATEVRCSEFGQAIIGNM